MHSRWPRLDGLAYGGDYNPELWPEEVWEQDVALMREAGVTLVSVGVFSWGMLEPRPGEFEFGWLDRVLGLLHAGGIAVDLGTPTAAPPPWFLRRHPEARPVTRDGLLLGGGSRQTYCPSSPAYASAAAGITRQLAERYGSHPAVVLWHVNNEYGAPLGECYCETSAAAFRDWLRERYGNLGALNDHWGAAFWSQRYGQWDEVEAPRTSATAVNPAQRLDFARFSSDALLACFRRERDILHALSPGIPVTTNFMATNCKSVDYWRWAPEVDVISNDNYLTAEATDGYLGLAMSADMSRSLAGGGPWLLMEHSTSAVSWQPRNIAKRPGEMRRNSLAHLARGADGVLFFQWRASRIGAEKHHSAMLPQGGTATRIWREVVGLGAEVASLASLRGTVVEPDLALLWDWESWWAHELDWRPSVDLGYLERVRAWHEAAFRAGLTADFAHPEADLSRYPLVVVPSLYLTTERAAANLRRYVEGGGTLLVGCFSGIVDDRDRVYPGPYPGALRDVLGLTVEEWLPLRAGERVTLTWEETGLSREMAGPGLGAVPAAYAVLPGASAVLPGASAVLPGASAVLPGPSAAIPGPSAAFARSATVVGSIHPGSPSPLSEPLGTADAWTEAVVLAGAKPVAWYADGPAAGGPAVTRHDLGEGRAWYVSARTDAPTTAAVLAAACDSAGLAPPAGSAGLPAPSAAPGGWPRGLELVRRTDGRRRFITLINHAETPATVQLPGGVVTVQAGDAQVITE
jgi:beta-galactosidase